MNTTAVLIGVTEALDRIRRARDAVDAIAYAAEFTEDATSVINAREKQRLPA